MVTQEPCPVRCGAHCPSLKAGIGRTQGREDRQVDNQFNVSRRCSEWVRWSNRFYQKAPIAIMAIVRPRRALHSTNVNSYNVANVGLLCVSNQDRGNVRVSKEASTGYHVVFNISVIKATFRELGLRSLLGRRDRRSAASHYLSATQEEDHCRGLEGRPAFRCYQFLSCGSASVSL